MSSQELGLLLKNLILLRNFNPSHVFSEVTIFKASKVNKAHCVRVFPVEYALEKHNSSELLFYIHAKVDSGMYGAFCLLLGCETTYELVLTGTVRLEICDNGCSSLQLAFL